ncbi:MAG: hypothetical protein WA985_04060 [Erythrobacter sp.]
MTIFALIMMGVFGFIAFRRFSSGRYLWGALSSFAVLIFAGTVWVDYQRHTTPVAQPDPERDRVFGDADFSTSN